MKKIELFFLLFTLALLGANNANAKNHYAEFATNVAKTSTWGWGVSYNLSTPLVKDRKYVMTLKAKTTDSSYTSCSFWPLKDGGKTTYSGFSLSTDWAVRTCSFTAGDDLDRLVFNFGQMKGNLSLDDIVIKEQDTNVTVFSIDFESGSFDSNWFFDWNKPVFYKVVEDFNPKFNHYFSMTTGGALTNMWDWGLTYLLDTTLEVDKTYVLSMRSRCSVESYNSLSFWPSGEDGTQYMGIGISNEWKENTLEFTAKKAINKLTWKFGDLDGTIDIDWVKLVVKGTETNLLTTGADFEDGSLPSGGWSLDNSSLASYSVKEGYEDFKAEKVSADVIATKAPWYKLVDGQYVLDPTNTDCSYVVGSETDAYYARYWGSNDMKCYADLTDYTAVRVYQDNSSNLPRIFFSNTAGDNQQQVLGFVWNEAGYYEFDLTKADAAVGNRRLLTLRPTGKGTCTAVKLVDPTINTTIAYKLSGDPLNGIKKQSAIDALADADAKAIDATGLSNVEPYNIASANPNCIFIANEGILSNTENVCIDGTINKLAIHDGKPIAIPSEATTATAASYDRAFSAAYSTVCLPFAATFTGKAYEYKATANEVVTFKEVNGTTLEAGKAYLVGNDFAVTGGSGALATVPAEGAFKGTFQKVTISSDASNSYYGFSGGEFVKIGNNGVVNPFRAYLTSTTLAAKLNVALGNDATVINNINTQNAIKAIYGVDGTQKSKLTKGINVLKMQNGETVKVNIK